MAAYKTVLWILLIVTATGTLCRMENPDQRDQTDRPLDNDDNLVAAGVRMLAATRRLSTISFTRCTKSHTLMYLSLLLLTNASDVELNPGPRTPKYPCQICHKAVTWKQRGVACDDCEQWYHANCMHMTTAVYMTLNNVSWHCVSCGMPNFATSLFDSLTIDSTSSFSCLDTTVSSTASPGPPNHCSSPVSQPNKESHPKTAFKILNINFQSIKNKREELLNLIDSSDPSVIMGTETWLNNGIHSSELFPPNYDVIRKDRPDGYGGVLLAIRKDLIFDNVPCSNSSAECIFANSKFIRTWP